jgi:serine protease Do
MGRLAFAVIAVLLVTVGVLAGSGQIFNGIGASTDAGLTLDDFGSGLTAKAAGYDGQPPPYVDEVIGAELDTVELVDEVGPAVVSIVTETMSYNIFYQPVPQTGAGTGVIATPDGYIVTNNHVVENAQKVTVTLSDGRTFEATSVTTDPETDLAVVKIDAGDLPYLHFLSGSLEQLNELDPVVAVGNALALPGGPTWTAGVVSNLGRSIELETDVVLYDLVQTDAAINQGNSGGPLVNMAGQVVGINVAIASNAENIGFAISTDTAIPVIAGLIAEGQVVRPWLGVSMLSVTPIIASQYSLSTDSGVLVVQVVSGSPADQAGLQPYDVVTSIGGQEVSTAEGMRLAIHARQVGDEVEIVYLRGSEQGTTRATLVAAAS